MAAPSETYVDPSIAGNSGTGTSGDPYGDLQYALDTMTRDSTNGDRINVQDSAAEVLTAALSLATYGTPTASAPLIFQGYTSAAGDGGIGEVSGGGSYSIINSTTYDYITFRDMELHNVGTGRIVRLDRYCVLIGCELHNTTGAGTLEWIEMDNFGLFINNYVHNCGGLGDFIATLVYGNHFENGTNDFNTAVHVRGGGLAIFNVLDIDGTSDGIRVGDSAMSGQAINNSIFSNGGTGAGITAQSTTGGPVTILNNIVEGFSGSGGIGIESLTDCDIHLLGFNAFYNNATNESFAGDVIFDLGNDQALGSSPFTDGANDDFTVSTAVQALAFPTANYQGLSVRTYLDIGALQRQEAGAGTTAGAGGLNLGHHRLGR